MSENSSSSSSGIGFTGLLTVIFVCAKVFELGPVAAWSWWWVLSPLWIGALFAVVFLFVAVVATWLLE